MAATAQQLARAIHPAMTPADLVRVLPPRGELMPSIYWAFRAAGPVHSFWVLWVSYGLVGWLPVVSEYTLPRLAGTLLLAAFYVSMDFNTRVLGPLHAYLATRRAPLPRVPRRGAGHRRSTV